MIPILLSYATPSTFQSDLDRASLSLCADQVRPVRFRGVVRRNTMLLRFALRALGELIWSSDDGYLTLDPIVMVHPDRVLLEAFSSDLSSYGMISINPQLFEIEEPVQCGVTNVDFTSWLWSALGEMRSSRRTTFSVGCQGLEVETRGGGGRFEPRVEVPERWLRAFLELSSAMAHPGPQLQVKPVDLLAAVRFLRYTKARVSPRGLRYEFEPGQEARMVLEPWEKAFPLRGCQHNYQHSHRTRVWGRQRLRLLEPLLPFATSARVFLRGRAMPHFYRLDLPDITFVLGLTGWGRQSWSQEASYSLLAPAGVGAPEDSAQVEALEQELASRWFLPTREVRGRQGALERLVRQGKVMFDLAAGCYRYRPLLSSGTPLDEERLFPASAVQERARGCLVEELQCLPEETRKLRKIKGPEGEAVREVIYRDWRISGKAAGVGVEIVVNGEERILFAHCSCPFFQENLLSRGPCEHALALYFASAEMRQVGPSSEPVEGDEAAALAQDRAKGDGADA